ncbi:MAG: YaeQ family protein [Pseudomonadota bacterium]
MALKATIFKTTLQIADMDRHYYHDHDFTIARHPSETDERMMVRLLAFALNADERLTFTRGISSEDEPDIWQKNLSGDIDLWIDLGQPDEKRIRKACARADRVIIYCFNDRSAPLWWQQIRGKLNRFGNLSVISLQGDATGSLAAMVERHMQLQYSIQDGEVWVSNGSDSIEIEVTQWM